MTSPSLVVITEPKSAQIVTPTTKPSTVVVASGGPSGPRGITGPGMSSHAWVIQGIILPEELMGFPVHIGENEKQSLVAIITVLKTGKKVKTELVKNEEAIPGFSPITVEVGKKRYLPEPVKLEEEDYIHINLLENEGTSLGMSFAVFIHHTTKE